MAELGTGLWDLDLRTTTWTCIATSLHNSHMIVAWSSLAHSDHSLQTHCSRLRSNEQTRCIVRGAGLTPLRPSLELWCSRAGSSHRGLLCIRCSKSMSKIRCCSRIASRSRTRLFWGIFGGLPGNLCSLTSGRWWLRDVCYLSPISYKSKLVYNQLKRMTNPWSSKIANGSHWRWSPGIRSWKSNRNLNLEYPQFADYCETSNYCKF